MEVRERKKADWLSGQGARLALLSGAFLGGGILGCCVTGLISGESVREMSAYLTDYLRLVRDGQAAGDLWGAVWGHLRWLLAIALLGMTALGVAGIPILFVVRGFLLTFSVGCFCRVFGAPGLFPAAALFGLPALLWGPALFVAGFQGLSSAGGLYRRGPGDPRSRNPFTLPWWLRLGLCGAVLLLCACLEYGLAPVILRAAARLMLTDG